MEKLKSISAILQIEEREDKKRTTLKLSDEDTSQSFRKSIMNEINLGKEAGEKSHTHTQTKDRATESAFHQELFIKTTWVNNPLLSPQTRHISAALSVVRWSERKQKASKYPQLNRGKSAWKREFVAEWNSQNSWHTQNSLFQLRNEFPGMGGSYLGSNHTCVI